jgi:hypothetical protein
MKLTKIRAVILLVLICNIWAEAPAAAAPALQKNQLSAFPNTFEAPTMPGQIPTSNYQPPKFSHSLFESDPKRKLRKPEFMDSVRYTSYGISRGELDQIFNFADQNHDDLIDQAEWDAFTALYLLPFEACDANNNYLLDVEEFKKCFAADPKSKLLSFRRRYHNKETTMMMQVVSTKGSDEINFSDYLFIRKSLFGWQQCHSNAKYIAISHFKCALKLTIPQKYHLKISVEDMYKVGLNLANDRALIELDYISYLRVLYFAYVFSIYSSPHDAPYLEQQQFIKAVREDRFPQNWEESEINLLYDLINTNPFKKNFTMNFSTFAFYFNLHRLFNKYSIEKPLQLSDPELQKLLNDSLSPSGVTLAIDLAKTNFSEPDYLEASVVLQKKRPNEGNFYYGFKEKAVAIQDASVTTHSFHDKNNIEARFQDDIPNEGNRHVFFTAMTGTDKKYWTKEIFYRTFTMANLFTSMCHDKRWLVAVPYFLDNLNNFYETVNPPIAQMFRNNYVVYKFLPREVSLDVLSFLELENWNFKIDQHIKSSNDYINETLLKMVLAEYGMVNMPDTVIDISRMGYDNLRRRQYSPSNTQKNVFIAHSTAAENARNKQDVVEYKLKLNKDDARKFPPLARRFMSSPNV